MKRSEVDKKYIWDLDSVYASDDLWEEDFRTFAGQIKKIADYKGKLGDKKVLLDMLKFSDATDMLAEKLYSYARMRSDQNVADNTYSALTDRAQGLLAEYSALSSFINPELCAQDEEYVKSLIADPDFSDYSYMFEGVLRRKQHILSENEEKLLWYAL